MIPATLISMLLSPMALANDITSVTVFADRAEVTRKSKAKCKKGVASSQFPHLPGTIDTRTLRGETNGDAVIGVSSQMVQLDQNINTRVADLEKNIEKITKNIRIIDDKIKLLVVNSSPISGYERYFQQVVSEGVRATKPNTENWAASLDMLLKERQTFNGKKSRLEKERLVQDRQLKMLKRQLSLIRGNPLKQGVNATVAVNCGKQNTVDIFLSYVISGASWRPEYDLSFKSDSTARVGKGVMTLQTNAHVRQSTGEDWNNVTLVLSTAKPKLGSEAPYPKALRVDGRLDSKDKVLVEGAEDRASLQSGTRAKSKKLTHSQLQNKGKSFDLTLDRAITVRSDGQDYWMPVDSIAIAADSQLVCMPRFSASVYQTLAFNNPAPYPLLQGRLNIQRNGATMGSQSIDYTAPGEPMEISLGVDGEIAFERKPMKEMDKAPGLFSSSKTLLRAYRVQLINQSQTVENIEIRESIPVSKDAEVKVEIDREKSSKGFQLDSHRGFVTWNATLQPNVQSNYDLVYKVILPESWQTK